ncbi:MAG: pantetheine-phosphate adenylyltransferase [Actinomycetota bacterium]
MITALVPGSFDPPTNGHLDIIERCADIFDRVVVAVANNPSKAPLFTAAERVALLEGCCAVWPNVAVASFDGLLVDVVRSSGSDVIVKGLRVITDFEYELQLAQMNRHLSGTVTLFVPTNAEYGYLSSSLVKEVAGFGASVEGLVPPTVARALKERLGDER